MITYNDIGYFGQLGNQMFQYAALLGVAKKLGLDYGVPDSNSNIMKKVAWYESRFRLKDYFNISAKNSENIEQKYFFRHEDANFNENIFQIQDNTNLLGYFQSEKYFSHCKYEILNEFSFKNQETYLNCQKFISKFDCPVSLHVRRGDYIHLQNVFNVNHFYYYVKAIKLIQETLSKKIDLLIFSDDIDWCKNNLKTMSKSIHYVSNSEHSSSQEEDLMIMSLCHHNIICNSSFSWWGAWLNKNNHKIVTAPKEWYSNMLLENYKDIYCDSWIIL